MKCLGFKRSPSTAMIGMLKRSASLAGKSLALASWPKNLTIGPEFDALVNKHGNAHAAFEAVENRLQRGAIAGQIGGATGQPIPRESRVECRNADGREDGIQRAELACHGDHADVPVAEMAADKDGGSRFRKVLAAFDADHSRRGGPLRSRRDARIRLRPVRCCHRSAAEVLRPRQASCPEMPYSGSG